MVMEEKLKNIAISILNNECSIELLIFNKRARRDSNSRPPGSKPGLLKLIFIKIIRSIRAN